MKMLLIALIMLLSICAQSGCGESKGEACITSCSSADHCYFYKRKFCPRSVSEFEDICIGGRLYKCRTPPESPCCGPYLNGKLTDFGSCSAQTEGCAADAPAPDSRENWRDYYPDGDTQ